MLKMTLILQYSIDPKINLKVTRTNSGKKNNMVYCIIKICIYS